MKLDTAALWQTLTKRAAALLADEQKRTGLLVAAGLLGLVLLGVSSWLPAKTEPTAEAAPQATAASAMKPTSRPACNRSSQTWRGQARPA